MRTRARAHAVGSVFMFAAIVSAMIPLKDHGQMTAAAQQTLANASLDDAQYMLNCQLVDATGAWVSPVADSVKVRAC